MYLFAGAGAETNRRPMRAVKPKTQIGDAAPQPPRSIVTHRQPIFMFPRRNSPQPEVRGASRKRHDTPSLVLPQHARYAPRACLMVSKITRRSATRFRRRFRAVVMFGSRCLPRSPGSSALCGFSLTSSPCRSCGRLSPPLCNRSRCACLRG
jgi:hypothetical protein